MISDAPINTPQVDQGGRPTIPWVGWFVQIVAALNGLLNAFTVGKNNAVTIANPAGLAFGGNFQGYTPVVSGSGSMTIASSTVNEATYLRVGPLVFLRINITVEFGGAASTNMTLSLPVASIGPRSASACNASASSSFNAWQPCVSFVQGAGITVFAGGDTATNFPIGQSLEIDITATYRCL